MVTTPWWDLDGYQDAGVEIDMLISVPGSEVSIRSIGGVDLRHVGCGGVRLRPPPPPEVTRMRVDSPVGQLEAAATRGGLISPFGPLSFDVEDVEDLGTCGEGDRCEVRFGNAEGPLGVLHVDVHDSGDPEDEGLSVGLRGWRLDDGIASV